jgi:hypothetical protein
MTDEANDECGGAGSQDQPAIPSPSSSAGARRWQPSLAAYAARRDARQKADELLRLAQLAPPEPFDGAAMWKAVEMSFRQADTLADAGEMPSEADVKALSAVRKDAAKLAKSLTEVSQRKTADTALFALLQKDLPDMAMAAHAAIIIKALAAGARDAASDVAAARLAGPAWPRKAGAPAAGWLLAELLPRVFTQFMRQAATFSTDSATSARSPCVQFIQAAHAVMGRNPPTDAAITQTVRRWKAAIAT